jgi:hypothetical protein
MNPELEALVLAYDALTTADNQKAPEVLQAFDPAECGLGKAPQPGSRATPKRSPPCAQRLGTRPVEAFDAAAQSLKGLEGRGSPRGYEE